MSFLFANADAATGGKSTTITMVFATAMFRKYGVRSHFRNCFLHKISNERTCIAKPMMVIMAMLIPRPKNSPSLSEGIFNSCVCAMKEGQLNGGGSFHDVIYFFTCFACFNNKLP